jgi:hypothetical protein
MRLARLLAPLVVAAGLAVVPATAAHAGCADDLVTALGGGDTIRFAIDPDYFVSVTGLEVTVYGDHVVALATGVTAFVVGRVVTLVGVAPGAVVTFADCVKL